MARTNPFQFVQQVRAEVSKVVWPTRRETGITTVMVMIMAAVFAVFFFLVDLLIRFSLETILLALLSVECSTAFQMEDILRMKVQKKITFAFGFLWICLIQLAGKWIETSTVLLFF